MSRERIAICNLSPLHLNKSEEDGHLFLSMPESFSYAEDGESYAYMGTLTNQAPIKCLLDRAYRKDGNPVTLIINLFSKECETEPDPYINEFGEEDRSTAEQYFVDTTIMYCDEQGIPEPRFERLPYDTTNPARSLNKLIEYLDNTDAIVDIDITGGLRDGITLIALALQTIQAKPESNNKGLTLGRIVYSNFQSKTITLQREVYSLVDLASAINAFTSYGKADQLLAYFDQSETSPEITELCEDLKRFSDCMSLCNTSIGDVVKRINHGLDKIDDKPKEEMVPSELLFASLIPVFREGFMKDAEHLTLNFVDAVSWCIDRNMIMQALAIFCERLSDYLAEIGWFEVDYLTFTSIETKPGDNICKACRFAKNGYLYIASPFSDCVTIAHPGDRTFKKVIAWFKLLVYQRNMVIHVDAQNNKFFDEKHVKELLGNDAIGELTVHDLKESLNSALESLFKLRKQ